MTAALDLALIDAAWLAMDTTPQANRQARLDGSVEPPSGVRARPTKPPLPLPVLARRYLRARLELEERMDAADRIAVEFDGVAYELVMVADRLNAAGEIVARGGIRVERWRNR